MFRKYHSTMRPRERRTSAVNIEAFSRLTPEPVANAFQSRSQYSYAFYFCFDTSDTPNEGSVKTVSPFVVLFFGDDEDIDVDVEEEDVFFFPVDFVPLCPAEDEGDFCFCFLSPDENSFVAGDFDVDVSFEVSAFPLPPNSAFTLIISPLPRARPPRLLFFFELFEEEEEEDTRDEEENSQPSWKLLLVHASKALCSL